jgi:hypothetical protein
MAVKPGEKKIPPAPADADPADEYTARMDRMVNALKSKRDTERKTAFKTSIIWCFVGAGLIALVIYLMLNISTTSFSDSFSFLKPHH